MADRIENGFICVGCARTKLGQHTVGRPVTPARCDICGQHDMTVRGVVPEAMRYREPDPPPPVEDRAFDEWAKEAAAPYGDEFCMNYARAAFHAGYEKGKQQGRAREREKMRDVLEDSRDE